MGHPTSRPPIKFRSNLIRPKPTRHPQITKTKNPKQMAYTVRPPQPQQLQGRGGEQPGGVIVVDPALARYLTAAREGDIPPAPPGMHSIVTRGFGFEGWELGGWVGIVLEWGRL